MNIHQMGKDVLNSKAVGKKNHKGDFLIDLIHES